MNANEIVRALRNCGGGPEGIKIVCSAADLIESLQAELAGRGEELKRLQKEVASLAIESIEREKTLAKLEAEVMVWAKAEQEGAAVECIEEAEDALRGDSHA